MSDQNSEILDRDQFRANLLAFTRQAYCMLPHLAKPRILDIGCGTGVSTLELARISGGDLIAVDIDRDALDKLITNAKREDLLSRVRVVQVSMLDMDFPPNSFDVIWTEGAISYIGFERGLREWRGLLVPGGYLVVHDAMSDLPGKIGLTRTCGYTIMGQLELPPNIWWNGYYAPLKKRLETLQEAGPLDKRIMKDIKTAKREIKEFDRENDRYGSVFFVLKRGEL